MSFRMIIRRHIAGHPDFCNVWIIERTPRGVQSWLLHSGAIRPHSLDRFRKFATKHNIPVNEEIQSLPFEDGTQPEIRKIDSLPGQQEFAFDEQQAG